MLYSAMLCDPAGEWAWRVVPYRCQRCDPADEHSRELLFSLHQAVCSVPAAHSDVTPPRCAPGVEEVSPFIREHLDDIFSPRLFLHH